MVLEIFDPSSPPFLLEPSEISLVTKTKFHLSLQNFEGLSQLAEL